MERLSWKSALPFEEEGRLTLRVEQRPEGPLWAQKAEHQTTENPSQPGNCMEFSWLDLNLLGTGNSCVPSSGSLLEWK